MANQPYLTYKAPTGEHIFDTLERAKRIAVKGRRVKAYHGALPNGYLFVSYDFDLVEFENSYYGQ